MSRKQKAILEQRPAHRRQAEAFEADPIRKATSWLIAFGIMAAALVLADAIVYVVRAAPTAAVPIMLDIVDLQGRLEDKERGTQQDKENVEDPKDEEKEDEEEEPEKEQPKEVVKPVPDKPVTDKPAAVEGPATDDRAPVIATAGTGSPQRIITGSRGGPDRAAAVAKFGGSPRTENAARIGLEWLARHQSADGRWSRVEFNRNCRPGKRCGGAGYHRAGYASVPLDPAMTGLALLCFAADNSTHLRGKYKANVAAGVAYLRRIQTKAGRFGSWPRGVDQYLMYNQGIATFALGELAVMSGDPKLKTAVEKAVRFIARAQQYRSGAWDYRDNQTGRYDTSVTGWQVMALKSAHAAGVEIPHYTLYKVTAFLDTVTRPNGEVYYSNKNPSAGRKGQGMVAVGMASGQFLGLPSHSRLAKRQTDIILKHLPDWGKLAPEPGKVSLDSIYYWYYATLAMFQAGGEPWETWNRQMKKELLLHQRRGGCSNGSWDPPHNFWGMVGGRLYSTTLNILNLQIYYRYLPIHSGGSLPTIDALVHTIEKKAGADAIQAVRLLARFDNRRAHNYLLQLAHGANRGLALEASFALAAERHPDSIGPLVQQLRSPNPFVRHRTLRALAPMIDQGLVPVFIESLNDPKASVSRLAAEILRRHANASFGFEPESPAAEREAAIRKWRKWWDAKERGAVLPDSELVWLVLNVRADKGLVAFTTGKAGLAREGAKYSIYRGDTFIGRILVLKVRDDIAIGEEIKQYTTDTFKEGDVVRERK